MEFSRDCEWGPEGRLDNCSPETSLAVTEIMDVLKGEVGKVEKQVMKR